MEWPKHRIYWTICSAITIGMIIGSILTEKGFEPREEFEVFTTYEKIKMLIVIACCFVTLYLAGTEYHELKRKTTKD